MARKTVINPDKLTADERALFLLDGQCESLLETLSAISAMNALIREFTIYENRPEGVTDYHLGGLFSGINLLTDKAAGTIEALQALRESA